MKYLIDTNVISELWRPQPNSSVVAWFQALPSEDLAISVLTVGEIRKGIEKLQPGQKKTQLLAWLDHELPVWFGDRILPITTEIADHWGYLLAQTNHPLSAIDSLIAATALTHHLRMVTRNTSDFKIPGLEIINPWIS